MNIQKIVVASIFLIISISSFAQNKYVCEIEKIYGDTAVPLLNKGIAFTTSSFKHKPPYLLDQSFGEASHEKFRLKVLKTDEKNLVVELWQIFNEQLEGGPQSTLRSSVLVSNGVEKISLRYLRYQLNCALEKSINIPPGEWTCYYDGAGEGAGARHKKKEIARKRTIKYCRESGRRSESECNMLTDCTPGAEYLPRWTCRACTQGICFKSSAYRLATAKIQSRYKCQRLKLMQVYGGGKGNFMNECKNFIECKAIPDVPKLHTCRTTTSEKKDFIWKAWSTEMSKALVVSLCISKSMGKNYECEDNVKCSN